MSATSTKWSMLLKDSSKSSCVLSKLTGISLKYVEFSLFTLFVKKVFICKLFVLMFTIATKGKLARLVIAELVIPIRLIVV